jgi:hypothetical protein
VFSDITFSSVMTIAGSVFAAIGLPLAILVGVGVACLIADAALGRILEKILGNRDNGGEV